MGVKIVAGKYRGVVIDAPDSARPTLTRHRQSLFDMLQSFGKCDLFCDKIILDCFAGSGALGIEALSRGAKFVYFVDNNKKACDILYANLQKVRAIENSKILCADIVKTTILSQTTFDIVFIDPPYAKYKLEKILKHIISAANVTSDTLFVIEEDAKNCTNLSELNLVCDILISRIIGGSIFRAINIQI